MIIGCVLPFIVQPVNKTAGTVPGDWSILNSPPYAVTVRVPSIVWMVGFMWRKTFRSL